MAGKAKYTTSDADHPVIGAVFNLTDLGAELREGYLHLALPAFELDPRVLRDYAVDIVQTQTPDALVDRLVHAVNQHMATEFLATRLMQDER